MREVVTTCDRCDKRVVQGGGTIARGLGEIAAPSHLCAACVVDFDAWIAAFRVEQKLARA